MRRLILLLLLCLSGVGLAPAPAHAADRIERPGTYFHGYFGTYTTRARAYLRIDPSVVNLQSTPQGPEGRRWDIQIGRADMRRATPPSWRTAMTGTTTRWHSFAIGSGQVLCLRVRQHSWQLTSPWSARTCVVRARDDQDLRRQRTPIRIVKDRHYHDGRASILLPRTRIVVPGVPRGAAYGPVFTNPGVRPNGNVCTSPSWHLRGRREPAGSTGTGDGAVDVLFHHASRSGAAILRSPFGRTCHVGGFLVVPRWVNR